MPGLGIRDGGRIVLCIVVIPGGWRPKHGRPARFGATLVFLDLEEANDPPSGGPDDGPLLHKVVGGVHNLGHGYMVPRGGAPVKRHTRGSSSRLWLRHSHY